ncbi:MAG TPA: ABC transporter permease [Polyangiaceae bacterium]|nr:ABC transporter permease [Polyangiaceae bacterium]
MVRYAFRRLLWLVPSVLGVSLLSFFLLSFLPSPAAPVGVAPEEWRDRFLNLPLFFNPAPADVRSLANAQIKRLVEAPAGSPEAESAGEELVRLGGAALVVVLPSLDALPPGERIRVALALAPIADRMGIDDPAVRDPEQVVVFWNRFWETRAVEFGPSTARSAVRRYARYGTEAREAQLRVLDTFALPFVIEQLSSPIEDQTMAELERLTKALRATTGRDDVISGSDSPLEVNATIYRWQRWWLDHQHDFQRLSGVDRVSGFILQSRYGKWVYETAVLRMGRDEAGRPVLTDLIRRARTTFTILILGLAFGYGLAVLIAAFTAWHRGQLADRVAAALILVPYALSPAVIGMIALYVVGPVEAPMTWAVATLVLISVADPARQGRAALVPVLASEHVRAARARGAGPFRVLFAHGLRNALAPVATRMSTEIPLALTACFVLERVFGLEGLGAATLEAVAAHDTRWLMALSLGGTVVAVAALVLSDVAYASLDPRLRGALTRATRRRR